MGFQICFNNRRGTCSRKSCRFLHEERQLEQCRAFLSPKGCRNGHRCPRGHYKNEKPQVSTVGPPTPALKNQFVTSQQTDESATTLSQWKHHQTRPGPYTPSQMGSFITGALFLLKSDDAQVAQEAIEILADHGESNGQNLKHLIQLLECTFQYGSMPHRMCIDDHAIPLMQVITDERFCSSVVVERYSSIIFNVLYGKEGEPGVSFLRTMLQNCQTFARHCDPAEFRRLFGLTAATLRLVVQKCAITASESPFHSVALEAILLADEQKLFSDPTQQQLRRDLAFLNEQLGIRRQLPSIAIQRPIGTRFLHRNEPPTAAISINLTVKTSVRLPGDLSGEGARHSNDHSAIERIQILPSLDEISFNDSEYVPRLWDRLPGLTTQEQLLDSQFRLFREDVVAGLRGTIRSLTKGGEPAKDSSKGEMPVLIHNATRLERIKFDDFNGIQLYVTFDQPFAESNTTNTTEKRIKWWASEHILEKGSLVCILNGTGKAVFFVVSKRHITKEDTKKHILHTRLKRFGDGPKMSYEIDKVEVQDIFTLAEQEKRAGIILKPAGNFGVSEITWLRDFARAGQHGRYRIIEFPGLIIDSFAPVLKGLQRKIKATQSIPFIDWLAPDLLVKYQHNPQNPALVFVPPPPYAGAVDFSFDLSGVFNTSTHLDSARLRPSDRESYDPLLLAENSFLDEGQAKAFIHALTNEVCLIQGPPGTGKSYVGSKVVKTLINNKDKANIGPILVVCATNHALDQFLEHLLEDDVRNIIRLGKRSLSEKLKPFVLSNISGHKGKTSFENRQTSISRNQMEAIVKAASPFCDVIQKGDSTYDLEGFLKDCYPYHYCFLFSFDSDMHGFKACAHSGDRTRFRKWLLGMCKGTPTRSIEEIKSEKDLWSLTPFERYAIIYQWRIEMLIEGDRQLSILQSDFNESRIHFFNVLREKDRRIVSCADVIGVTSSSLALHADLLEPLPIKVLFCEEAAEILEAHAVTTLLPSVEHMVLIGDHEQLRPRVESYSLSVESRKGKEHALDVSLFERLTRQQFPGQEGLLRFPVVSLETQRRMHPTIADMIRLKTYPRLKDDVPEYPLIPGMKKRLFWLHHDNPETRGEGLKHNRSSKNYFEQDMVVGLVNHLVQQGRFKEGQIAVLTPYLDQMEKIRTKLMAVVNVITDAKDEDDLARASSILGMLSTTPAVIPKEKKSTKKATLAGTVRIATVDNFQGEEAEVVILSLVRSNQDNQSGFLTSSNRMNVLLSRAKWGMYIIGNSDTLASSPMYKDVVDLLVQKDCFGNRLQLECPRHPDLNIEVANAADFKKYAPEGGCDKQCDWRLSCGHRCRAKCHCETIHDAVYCPEPCTRKLQGCDHRCSLKCGDKCAPCAVPVHNTILECGHKKRSMTCHAFQNREIVKPPCMVKVFKTVPGCSHTIQVDCQVDVTSIDFKCPAVCNGPLGCSHSCKKTCGDCTIKAKDGTLSFNLSHWDCTATCNRPFNTCSHSCEKLCHGSSDCKVCERQCEVRCVHSQCMETCQGPCAPCAEMCTVGCEHQGCIMPCGAPCNILPCNERCTKILECGHQCPSICGERCPDKSLCKTCASPKVLDSVVDLVMLQSYRDTDTDAEPLIFLDCGHFYTINTLDGATDMKAYFELATEGWTVLSKRTDDETLEELRKSNDQATFVLPRCPECRSAITTSSRYNGIVKKAQLQNNIRRFGILGARQLWPLIEELENQEHDLETTRARVPDNFKLDKFLHARYAELGRLETFINNYNQFVQTTSQPHYRVHELATYACVKNGLPVSDYEAVGVQHKFEIEGKYLALRAKILVFTDLDIITSRRSVLPSILQAARKKFMPFIKNLRAPCDELIAKCQERSFPRQEIQTRIVKAKINILVIKYNADVAEDDRMSNEALKALQDTTRRDLQNCLEITRTTGSCGILEKNVEEAINSLNGQVFKTAVTDREMKEIYEALQADFVSTGHWYVCPNGHPFTIGECGRAFVLGTCNECGAAIGGQNHHNVEGVAELEMDDWMGRIQLGLD